MNLLWLDLNKKFLLICSFETKVYESKSSFFGQHANAITFFQGQKLWNGLYFLSLFRNTFKKMLKEARILICLSWHKNALSIGGEKN